MEAVVFNLFREVPAITRVWVAGCVGVSILTTTGAISRTNILYNYDLVFHKKQYLRLIYSLFDYGELNWSTIVDIIVSANHLSTLEKTLDSKRRFIWMITIVFTMIIIMSSFIQPASSLGSLLHQNLVYYLYKTSNDAINVPIFGGNQLVLAFLPLNMALMMYFVGHKSLLEVSISFIAGHTLYYCDTILLKLYGLDFCKTPYDYWKEWKQRNEPIENNEGN